MNRVKHSDFPNTIAGVIYQPGAFTAVSDGQINHPIDQNSSVYKAAQDAKNGWDPTGGCIYYFTKMLPIQNSIKAYDNASSRPISVILFLIARSVLSYFPSFKGRRRTDVERSC